MSRRSLASTSCCAETSLPTCVIFVAADVDFVTDEVGIEVAGDGGVHRGIEAQYGKTTSALDIHHIHSLAVGLDSEADVHAGHGHALRPWGLDIRQANLVFEGLQG